MKNKFGITAAAILVALSLAACSSNKSNQSSSSSSKATSSKVEKKTSSQSSSSTSSSSSSTSQSSKPSSQSPKESRISKLTSDLRKVFPNMTLPTNDGLGQGSSKLNVRYNKSGNTNIIYYSVGNSAADFNAASVKNEKPYAVLTEVTNASSSEASDLINYIPAQSGLPTKKLDSSTTATIQGAAGQRYLQWNSDNYSFVIQASSQLKEDPTDRGKKVLALYKQYGLPKTSNKGSLHVTVGDSVGSLNTVIAWQDGSNVYQIQAHDTETAFKMLASLK